MQDEVLYDHPNLHLYFQKRKEKEKHFQTFVCESIGMFNSSIRKITVSKKPEKEAS